jgi:protein involved in polysaccharide export with SLBB domain
LEAELTRYAIVDGQYRETELINVNLAAVLRGDQTADMAIASYDFLNVREVPRWREEASVTIRGEVTFAGTYPIRRGETLSSVLDRAGGVSVRAFPEGSVFTRVELRERERTNLDNLARRIETDLASISLADPNSADAISVGQSLLTQLRSAVPTGRLVINLDQILAGLEGSDVLLRDGDELFVPLQTQDVTIIGEVQYPTSHLYSAGVTRDDYIARSGGLTRRADEKLVYVVRANGEVVVENGRRWFSRDSGGEIRPGDTIVAPLDVDRVRPLARWSSITNVIYTMAIAAAAVASF